MSDVISLSDRTMIDAAIVDGAVMRIEATTVESRRNRVAAMAKHGASPKAMAARLGVSVATIHADRKALGLTRKREPNQGDTAGLKRARRASGKVREIADRRRFKISSVPMGQPKLAPSRAVGTIFPNRVFEFTGEELVLKDGCNNAKIGGDVLVGRLKGAYIVTLTLEERATCPATCRLWRECYGNTMQYARRWQPGPVLESQIKAEIAKACANNELVLVRLHVLGDFYSVEYLQMWADLLDAHQGLFIFGFTAWPIGTKIGDGVAWLRQQAPDRFAVRTSGATGKWGSFTIDFPTEKTRIGDAVVCPEQRAAMTGNKRGKHCGNCALCWQSDVPIAFVKH